MRALVFERNLPRFAASRMASLLGSGRGAGIGPLQLPDAEPPDLPGDDWSISPPAWRVSADPTSPHWTAAAPATSRTWSVSPSSPAMRWWASWPTGAGITAATSSAPGTRAVIEPVLGCAARHIVPRARYCSYGQHRPLRERGLRRPRTRAADRILHRHRGRLVDGCPLRPRLPATRRPRVVLRRGGGDRRAHGLRRPRRAVGRGRRRRRGGCGGCGDAGTGLHRGPPLSRPPSRACTIIVGAKLRTSAAAGRGARGRRGGGPRSAGPGRAAPVGFAGAGRTADRRRRRGLRLRGFRRVDRPRRWPWSDPVDGWCWWACRARFPWTWHRCGTAS